VTPKSNKSAGSYGVRHSNAERTQNTLPDPGDTFLFGFMARRNFCLFNFRGEGKWQPKE
jgi:hypothetical protein